MKKILCVAVILAVFCPLVYAEKPLPIMRSVCLLKSPKGSGSGFFAEVDGKNVLITNNHVILEMPDVRILDINGKTYEYDVIYCSSDKDLAVIPLERDNTDSMPNLKIHQQPDMLMHNRVVTAYGDSLGDGVIVSVNGKFLGIGPNVVEVSAAFVPGNSGGPVVDSVSGQVIGVATYARIYRQMSTTTGSRFEAKSGVKPAVRRFATRIDHLSLAGFEKVDKQKIKEDQANYFRIQERYNAIWDILFSNRSTEQQYTLLQRLFTDKLNLPVAGKWNTTFLKKETYRKYELIKIIHSILYPSSADLSKVSFSEELKNSWLAKLDKITFKSYSPFSAKCPKCNGTGKFKIPLADWELKEAKRNMQPSYKYAACSVCKGKGTFVLSGPVEYALLPPDFSSDLASYFTPEEKSICGFQVGTVIPELSATDKKVYSRKRQKTRRKDVFTIYRFPGNHKFPQAQETRFWFFGQLLLRVDVIIPVENEPVMSSTIGNLDKEYSVMEHGKLSTALVQKAGTLDDIPKMLREAQKKGKQKAANISNPYSMAVRDEFSNREDKITFRQISNVKNAMATDPFGIFYRDPSAYPAFLMVTIQHEAFEACRNLMKIKESGFSFSSK